MSKVVPITSLHNKREPSMEKARLKLIVRNMKLLVDSLESEIYSDPEAYTNQSDYAKIGLTYREDNDDDGYTD